MIKLPRLLAADGTEERRIRPAKVSITEKITPLSTATMELPDQERIPDRSYVELYLPSRSAGIFRARIPDDGYGKATTSVKLEHAVCEVGDWVITVAIKESVLSFPAALSLVFSHYRGTLWKLGTVEAYEDVVCNISVMNVLKAMLSLVAQVPTCYMDFDFSTTPWTINILRLPEEVTAEGRLSRNVISARVSRDDSQLFTRAYLAGLPAEEWEDIGHLDADTVNQYGVIETVLPEGDYTEEEAWLVANTYLERHKKPVVSVQIDGVDFSAITGESLDALRIGKLYRLAVEGVEDPIEEHITQLSWRSVYDQHGMVTIQLSAEAETAVKIIHDQTISQEASSSLSNNRQEESKADTAARFATGSLSITAADYTSPTDYTITISGGLSTVNYAVLIVPDNESGSAAVDLPGFDYSIFAKNRTGFTARIRIPTFPAGVDTILLRWFATAK